MINKSQDQHNQVSKKEIRPAYQLDSQAMKTIKSLSVQALNSKVEEDLKIFSQHKIPLRK